jgi:hypothetical protein
MFKCTFLLLVVSCFVANALWAADTAFVGEWKLDPAKSKMIDEMKVESVGANKYAFDFGGGSSETIVVDGTDQPGIFGTTLAVSVEGPDAWKVVRKKEGRMLLTAHWKLSQDGKTLKDNYTEFAPNGSASTVDYVYARTAGKLAGQSGFAGSWDNINETVESAYVLQVKPFEGNGLSFIDPSQNETKNVKFDGKDYPRVAPHEVPGSTSSIRRVDEHTLEMTDKVNGKVMATEEIQLSSDRKTLTMTAHIDGRSKPNVLVFERQ